MFKSVATLALFFCISFIDGTTKLRSCQRTTDCFGDEVCLSYTCNGNQVKKCIPRSCHRSNAGCPGGIVCYPEKHCSDISCAINN